MAAGSTVPLGQRLPGRPTPAFARVAAPMPPLRAADELGEALGLARRTEANLERLGRLMGPEKAARAIEEAVGNLERKEAAARAAAMRRAP